MTQDQFNEFKEKFGQEAATEMKKHATQIEQSLSAKFEDMTKGLVRPDDFEKFKTDSLKEYNDKLSKLEGIATEQGNKINELLKPAAAGSKSLEDFIQEQAPKIKELRSTGKMMEFTSAELKAAGITSIGNSIQAMTSPPTSPYLPGIGGTGLELFDIMKDPNYIINRVDMGRTNQSRLAWVNETAYEPGPAEVAEGALKPLTQHKFQVEMSLAKKIAGYITITEEFEDDLPGFGTTVRRMLQEDVIRKFDDTIQANVIAVARPFEIAGLTDQVIDANMYDGLGAMLAQIGQYNFIPNTIGLNPVTMWKMLMLKSTLSGEYLIPPFLQTLNQYISQANKVALKYALVGDLRQYKVDMYKDFVLKVGWINDDLIKNQFAVVGELRYHSYISDNRKKALCYANVQNVANVIDGAPTS